jgi:iron complex transport system substrate-binding protein
VRVVSLLPSATEIVCALGHGRELVARSAECDFPPEVANLPAVMHPKALDTGAPSRQIDERVRATRGSGESLYTLDIPALKRLRPDLLLTQDLCGVCSVTEAEVVAACAGAGIAPKVVSLTPRTLDDVWRSIEVVANALGDPTSGRALADRLRARSQSGTAVRRRRIAIVEWLDPPILAGLWSSDIVRAAGGVPIGPGSGEPGLRTDWAAVASASPEVLVVSPCSFHVERTLEELRDPALSKAVARAAPHGEVLLADEAYFSRPGPRLADGVELVRALVNGVPPTAPMPIAKWSHARRAAA